jgi:signal transduction histidine kinase
LATDGIELTSKDEISTRVTELTALLVDNLREALFSSRAYLRPSDLRPVAGTQAQAFLAYLQDGDGDAAQGHGAYLCLNGVGDQALLRVSQILRRFGGAHLSAATLLDYLERVDEYQRHVIQGYMVQRAADILEEQERIRSALQQNLQRYTLQLETAAELARTAIAPLDLGSLLTTAVDLIGERFGLDYMAIYLVEDDSGFAELRAATGQEGRIRLVARHKLNASGASTVAKCLATRQHVLVPTRKDGASLAGSSWLPDTQSEIVLPLITHGRVIGALSAQSTRSGAFSSQDVVGFQIMCDQLANAIENTRLYADAQRRAEDLALAYDQLKDLEVLKDQFMQNVSHELRTPLTMIRGYAEFILAGQLGRVDFEQREALQVILRNSEALSELVTDILAMLEISSTKTALAAISLAEVVQNSVAAFQIVANRSGVALSSDLFPCDGSCFVMARPDHLRRIADNLLGNALKFTPAGGRVDVRLWEENLGVYLEVADTGIGIPAHLHERIFERFFQVDSSHRRARGGAGLGLALVRELVEGYGGRVQAASPGIDQGSTFTAFLPRAAV